MVGEWIVSSGAGANTEKNVRDHTCGWPTVSEPVGLCGGGQLEGAGDTMRTIEFVSSNGRGARGHGKA